MMQSYDAVWVDQNITAHLLPIRTGLAGFRATQHHPNIFHNRDWIINGPPTASFHSVMGVKIAAMVKQDRPRQLGRGGICLRHRVIVESDDLHNDLKLLQLFLLEPQLRHVFTARRSAKVAMKNQQQPVDAIRF